jgi:hypothetical protein
VSQSAPVAAQVFGLAAFSAALTYIVAGRMYETHPATAGT